MTCAVLFFLVLFLFYLLTPLVANRVSIVILGVLSSPIFIRLNAKYGAGLRLLMPGS